MKSSSSVTLEGCLSSAGTIAARQAAARLTLALIVTLAIWSLFTTPARCQSLSWFRDPSPIMAWDPVTGYGDGTQFPAGTTARYHTFYRIAPSGEAVQIGGVVIGTAAEMTPLPVDRLVHLGVRSVSYRDGAEYPAGDTAKSRSAISWSSDPLATNNKPFGVATRETAPPGPRVTLSP
jgi:hypothetical protein